MDKQDAAAVRSGAGKDGKYLTFSLAEEEYGLGVLKVREIIGLAPVTAVPRAPRCVKGVIIDRVLGDEHARAVQEAA